MEEVKQITLNVPNKRITRALIQENKDKKDKKRVAAENWSFPIENYLYEKQMKMIKDIHANNYNHIDEVSKIAIQQINRKIYGYKQQDIIKKLLNEEHFINIQSIINKMLECELKCYYCSDSMNILYDISREMKQWSVDRIDNDKGHNLDNYYLACLECNLKRRRRSDEKFLFTKQLKIVKKEDLDKKDDSLIN